MLSLHRHTGALQVALSMFPEAGSHPADLAHVWSAIQAVRTAYSHFISLNYFTDFSSSSYVLVLLSVEKRLTSRDNAGEGLNAAVYVHLEVVLEPRR